MSKQVPKQRTLDFFLQKPKTQGQGASNSKNASTNTDNQEKSTKATTSTTTTASGPAKSTSKPVPAAPKKVQDVNIDEVASSPLMAFPSSRSIPSDERSVGSAHSASRSRASSPPASEAADIDMMDEDEEEVGYLPVSSTYFLLYLFMMG